MFTKSPNPLYSLLTLVFVGLFGANLHAQSPEKVRTIPGQYYVKISQKAAKSNTINAQDLEQLLTGAELEPVVKQEHILSFKQKNAAKAQKMSARGVEPLARTRDVYRMKMTESDLNIKTLRKLQQQGVIDYFEPVYIYETHEVPNDPEVRRSDFDPGELTAAMETMRFYGAWEKQKSDSSVVIAILDSGVNLDHIDLASKTWVNTAELTGEAGVDDDGNGFVDDIYGWDFFGGGDFSSPRDDNDPNIDASDHGAHVAGSAAAATNNGIGIAGAGYNARYMAVKLGGRQVPGVDGAERSIIRTLDGFIYALINGADVVNCSFGGGGYSQTIQNVVNDLADMGAVVVASAGNSGEPTVGYPSAYDNVISVGWAQANDMMSSGSNFGPRLDVVGVGSNIYSTTTGTITFGFSSGTSMSAPMVSGLAALLKSEHPDWSPQRIAIQIRSSARNIDDVNSFSYQNLLGGGMIDAERALGEPLPGLRLLGYRFENADGGKLGFDEPGKVVIDLINDGAAATIDFDTEFASVIWDISETNNLTGIQVGENEQITLELEATLKRTFNAETDIPGIILKITDNDVYNDTYTLRYDDLTFNTHSDNDIVMSYTANGIIGVANPNTGQGGVGFVPRNDSLIFGNLLYEGGLMLTTMPNDSTTTIAAAVRGATNGTFRRDFTLDDIVRFGFSEKEENTIQGRTSFGVKFGKRIPLRIDLNTFASVDEAYKRGIIFEYTLQNTSETDPINQLRLGLYNDWDIPPFDQNTTEWIPQDSILLVRSADERFPLVAVVPFDPIASVLSIDNGYAGEVDSLNFGLFDEDFFSNEEVVWSMTAEKKKPVVSTPTDISVVTASGPYTLEPNTTQKVTFAYVWGQTIEELRLNVWNMRAWYERYNDPTYTSVEEELVSDLPTSMELLPAYPNPFNPSTTLRFNLQQSGNVRLQVYDLQGRLVSTLREGRLAAGSYQVPFNATNLSSGIYLVRLQADGQSQLQKISLIK